MNPWDGLERRKECRKVQETIAVLQERTNTVKDKIDTLDEEMKLLNNQLITLVAQIPNLTESIKDLANRIGGHESNAVIRQKEFGVCRDARIVASNSVRWLWLIVSAILLTNVGMLLHLITRK